jgi:hypothetical protein
MSSFIVVVVVVVVVCVENVSVVCVSCIDVLSVSCVVGVRMRDLTSTTDLTHSTTNFDLNFDHKVEFKVGPQL